MRVTLKINVFQCGKKHFSKLAALIVFSLASCITVNVNFPESAVQRAADDFVRDLYKGVQTAPQPKTDEEVESATKGVKKSVKKNKKMESSFFKVLSHPVLVSLVFISNANAAPTLTKPPAADGIQSSMSARLPKLEQWKKSGAVCQQRDGKLLFANPSAAGGNPAEVKGLVDAENSDREKLFQAYEQANDIRVDSNKAKMREIFAESLLKVSPYPCK